MGLPLSCVCGAFCLLAGCLNGEILGELCSVFYFLGLDFVLEFQYFFFLEGGNHVFILFGVSGMNLLVGKVLLAKHHCTLLQSGYAPNHQSAAKKHILSPPVAISANKMVIIMFGRPKRRDRGSSHRINRELAASASTEQSGSQAELWRSRLCIFIYFFWQWVCFTAIAY